MLPREIGVNVPVPTRSRRVHGHLPMLAAMITKSWAFGVLTGAGITVVALLIFIVATGPDQPPTSYASAYMEALDQFPAQSSVPQEHLQRFVEHFTHMADVSQPTLEMLYAKNVYFSDGLLTTTQRAGVFQHFHAMHNSGTELTLRVIDTVTKGGDVYLVWWSQLSFAPLIKPVTSQAIGITHVRFNARGQVVLQQDYWDTSEAFYKQLPIIGALIRQINTRFEYHEQ